ncbi:MAG: hypothetical protein CL843_10145 [Crocinitomicaceae bacterium]|nr:hypothetical protein [Crocinitomicaceae bacterium]
MKIKVYITLLLLLWVITCPLLLMAQGVPTMINYTVDDGLPSSETHDVLQDSKGYIWIATDRGVSRYNGYEFENFTTKNGLPDNTIFEIREDSLGRIWFLTMNSRLCYFQDEAFHPYTWNSSISKAVDSLGIISGTVFDNFFIDHKMNLTLNFASSGFIKITPNGDISTAKRIDNNKSEFHLIDTLPYAYGILSPTDYSFYSLYENDSLISTYSKSYPLYPGISQKIIPFNKGNDHFSNRFFSTKNFLFEHSQYAIRKIYKAPNDINCIVAVDGKIWIGSSFSGIDILNQKGEKIDHILDSISVSEIYCSNDNKVWITTLDNGVFYIPNNAIINFTPESQLSHSISSIASLKNYIYIAYNNNRLNVYNTNFGLLNSYNIGSPIPGIHYDESIQQCWVSTKDKGIKLLDENRIIHLNTNRLTHVSITPVKNNGIVTFRKKNTSFYHFINTDHPPQLELINELDLENNSQSVDCSYYDGKTIWTGTPNGLSKFDANNMLKEVTYLGNKIKLLSNRITCIAEKDSVLWLGTRGNGIVLFDKKNHASYLNHALNFNPQNINAILINKNYIWVASNIGLILITEINPSLYTFQQINTSSGLSTNEVTSLDMIGDSLLVGTKKGLNIINTKNFSLNDSKKMPVFTAINVAGELLTDTSNIEITYDKNSIDFSYLTFAYGTGGDITYQYKIDELDQEWFSTKDRTARFVALPPGDYTFKVRTLKNDSSWTEANLLHFSVLPAFWQTWYFWVAIGLVFVIVISAIAYNSIKNANERSEMNARIENLRQNSLSSQMNPHFVFNVLNSILTFLLTNSQRNAAKYLSSFAWLMRKTFNLSKVNKITLEEELDVLTSYFKLEKLRISDKITFQLEVDPKLDVESLMVPPLILQPFVENAILHGISQDQTTSVIAVQLTLEGNYMKVVIEDNGIGIEKSKQEKEKHPQAASHKSSGLDISKERVALLHKIKNEKALVEIVDLSSFESANKTGTRVTFYLPLTED